MSRPRSVRRFDRAYYDRFYRGPERVHSPAQRARTVRFAVAMAEYVLDRPVRSVLDAGCGEGDWRAVLRRVRPGASYLGVDASEYAVGRFGKARNLQLGRLGDLGAMKLGGPFDLVVCAGTLWYLGDDELVRALRALASLAGGLAYLEAFAAGDHIVGDVRGCPWRPPARWRELLATSGFEAIGPHCYVTSETAQTLVELERPSRMRER